MKTHVSNILMKLDLADRTQAALWAVRHGWRLVRARSARATAATRRVPFRAEIHTVVGMSPGWRILRGSPAVLQCVPRRPAAVIAGRAQTVKNLKKAAAVTMVAGGLVAAGAGLRLRHGRRLRGRQGRRAPRASSRATSSRPRSHVPVNVVGNSVNVIGVAEPRLRQPRPQPLRHHDTEAPSPDLRPPGYATREADGRRLRPSGA